MMDVEMSNPDTIMESQNCMEAKIEDEEWVFVDLQGYKISYSRFMCKEFCLINGQEKFHAIVKSWYPYNKIMSLYKRQIEWLSKNFHKLDYNCGDLDINELTKLVYPKLLGKVVIVKGADKIKWMKYIFRKYGDISCRNIEDLSYEMSDQWNGNNYALCEYHNALYGWSKCHCAMSNALKIQDISNINAPIRFF